MKSRFKNAHPLMVYMSIKQRALVKLFSQKQRLPVSQLVREGLLMRMAVDDRYNSGWNDALDEAMRIANDSNAGKMMFPSGRSFSQMICDDIVEMKRDLKDLNEFKEVNETTVLNNEEKK